MIESARRRILNRRLIVGLSSIRRVAERDRLESYLWQNRYDCSVWLMLRTCVTCRQKISRGSQLHDEVVTWQRSNKSIRQNHEAEAWRTRVMNVQRKSGDVSPGLRCPWMLQQFIRKYLVARGEYLMAVNWNRISFQASRRSQANF